MNVLNVSAPHSDTEFNNLSTVVGTFNSDLSIAGEVVPHSDTSKDSKDSVTDIKDKVVV